MVKPQLSYRVKANIADSFILMLLILSIAWLFNTFGVESITPKIFAFIGLAMYEPILTSWGGTIGQRWMGLRVVNSSRFIRKGQERNINILSSIFRYFFKLTLGVISFFTIHIDENGRAMHDRLSGSLMVYR